MGRIGLVLVGMLWACAAWGQGPRLDAERQKNFGLAYLEEKQPRKAVEAFRQVVERAPEEPLGYADLGLCFLRMGKADSAAVWLHRAQAVAPRNVEVLLLLTEFHLWKGDWAAGVETAKRAVALRPDNPFAGYALYRAASSQQGAAGADTLSARALRRLFRMAPGNPVVAAKYGRLGAERGDWGAVRSALRALRPVARDVADADLVLSQIDRAVAAQDRRGARRGLVILENVIRPTPRYRQALDRIQAPAGGLPMTRFSEAFYRSLGRERPPAVPVRFEPLPAGALPQVRAMGDGKTAAFGSLEFADVDGNGQGDVLTSFEAGSKGDVQLWLREDGRWRPALPKGAGGPTPAARLVDFDNDGVFDVAAAGPGGLRLFKGDSTGTWREVTTQAGFTKAPAHALELVDFDNDGDMDLCVGGGNGVRVWQNDLDGTFRDATKRTGLAGAGPGTQAVLAADLDDDLDADLLVLDGRGRLRLFDNLRQGRFAEVERGLDSTACRAALAADFDNDGWLDLVQVHQDGSVYMQRNTGGGRFAPPVRLGTGGLSVRVLTSLDFDNDGWLDLALAGTEKGAPALAVLRNGGDGTWTLQFLASPPEGCVALEGADLDGDGDMDLLALDGRGRVRGWRNDGGNANHWLNVRLKGLRVAGVQSDLHGFGCKLEVKAGRDYQVRFVRRPVTHFGLGAHRQADLLRVVWSNGVPQNRLRPDADQTLLEPQVLTGSCPYLYSWDGEGFAFVTDLLSGAPLGLQLADGVIAPYNPRELVKLPREKVATQYGEFVFQYSEELWETVYLDAVSLWSVDHPAGVGVFTDERALPPPYTAPAPILVRRRIDPVRAEDTAGRDVTEAVRAFDYRYPEALRPSRYEGTVAPHTLTLFFGDVRALAHPVLVVGGWYFSTDSSVNVSQSQGTAVPAGATTVEVWRPGSGWRAIGRPFGELNGKDKYAVLDLSRDLYRPDARVRIRSTAQMYWDVAFLADEVPSAPHRITRLAPRAADLHYGGFSRMYRPSPDGPHLYDYSRKTFLPLWMDMHGMATRYGDVTELLTRADDRFVIFTGGDEVTLRFEASALPPLPPGWERDFLFFSEGWGKDSDRNTVTGNTVGPLPFHAMSAYPYPPSESYPEDAAHRAYRARYNTRRLGPERFRNFARVYRGGPLPPVPWEAFLKEAP